ncbi:MAG: helix-turn-helix transcriptional regulator [Phycisphaerales bacterium]|nr:helix-turn-helix transcriptional regulator [Phycisphaerales bacterium]
MLNLPAVDASPVQTVLLVDRLERLQPGYQFVANSLPGHLIQVMIDGRTLHEANGRHYTLEPYSLIWYHEDELVRGRVLEGPWRFYTVNFIAPALNPPAFEDRVRRVDDRTMAHFAALLEAWRDISIPPAARQMLVQARMLDLLAGLSGTGQPYAMNPAARLWWELETQLRKDLRRPIDLELMAQLSGRSQATIARACRCAVGMPPARRIKQIRLSLARGLVQRSDQGISQIADGVGYDRVHEFSRDYRKHFGLPPTADRKDSSGA